MVLRYVLKLCVSLVTVGVFIGHLSCVQGCGRGSIYLRNNEYHKILIAIGDGVPEDANLLERIKEVFTKASAYLYEVTNNRAFLKDVTILIPKTWSDSPDYIAATKETMDVSDIVVDPPDSRYDHGHKPFVIKTTPCGQLGHYMHLTPQYLTDDNIAAEFGSNEKVIVHEWSHLRYGVYDEYPEGEAVPHFYAADNGEIEGTRCSKALQGDFYDIVKGSRECDFANGLPDDNCIFQDKKETSGKYGSLMYRQQLEHVTRFCDNDTSSPLTFHNRQSPSTHNRVCDGKSVWEVLREHGDFEKGANPPRNISSTAPTFRLVKYGSKRTVLVLDVSGSMNTNNRLRKLAQAANNFLMNIARDGERIGIVWFDEKAVIKSYLLDINDANRQTLVDEIPLIAHGATAIGDGILKGIDVLSEGGQDPKGGVILLVSDGKETHPPWVSTVQPEVIDKGITVDTIAVTSDADIKLEELAANTGGMSFYFSDSETSNALNEAFIAIGERGTGVLERPIQLVSQSLVLQTDESVEDIVLIDSTIGRSTEFLIGYQYHVVEVEVTTPSGRKISKGDSEYEEDAAFSLTRIKIPGTAQRGQWKVRVTNPNSKETVAITVTSGVSNPDEYPILAQASWAQKSISFPGQYQTLYVSVSQGLAPVLMAEVKAYLERPDIGRSPSASLELTLRDNGAGADISKEDGVYSGFVANFTDNGRYYVRVVVNNSPVSVVHKSKIVGTGGIQASGNVLSNRDRRSTEATEDFQRITSAGSFELTDFTPGFDGYPPAKTTDLRVAAVSHHREIILEWTAPGDALDQGQASAYIIWRAIDFDTLYERHTEAIQISHGMVPQKAGSTERLALEVEGLGAITYYFTVEAVDDRGNKSPRSNIVGASMKYLKPALNVELLVGLLITVIVFIGLFIAGVVLYCKHKRNTDNLKTKGEKYKTSNTIPKSKSTC